MKRILPLIILGLCDCASTPQSYQHYYTGRGLNTQSPEHFQHCRGYGCKYDDEINLSAKDWRTIKAVFKPAAKTAAAERKQIAQAIGLMEKKVGAITGSEADKAGTFETLGDQQLDCVDESTNSTIYLDLLQQQKLLRFHEVRAPTMRLPIVNSGTWPHQAAIIRETTSGNLFAVDSWFHDNGEAAEIIELNQWKDGWRPDDRA